MPILNHDESASPTNPAGETTTNSRPDDPSCAASTRGGTPIPAKTYRLVIFDFDGTLADTFAWFGSVLDEVADRYRFRRVEPEQVEAVRRMTAHEIIRFVGLPAWKVPLVSRHMRALAARDIAAFGLFPGIEPMLTALERHGVELALVSSNSETNIRHVLGPLAARFRHYDCGSGLFGKARRLCRVMQRIGIAPDATLAIGDELRDLDAARAAGCAFGAVTWGYTQADALAASAPDHLFTTPEEIAALVTSAAQSLQRPRPLPGTAALGAEPKGS